MKKPNLILESILNKKFSVELSGYSAIEVDKFLDLIIEDYRIYKLAIETLEQKLIEKTDLLENRDDEIKRLKFECDNLKIQLRESVKASNYEILKEIKKINQTKLSGNKKNKNVT